MSVNGIEGLGAGGFTPYVAPQVGPTGPTAPSAPSTGGTGGTGGPDTGFSDLVLDGLDRLDGVQRDRKSVV